VIKIISFFYICCRLSIVSVAKEPIFTQLAIHDLVTKIKYATPIEKRLLLDTLKVQLKTSQKKIRHQVMVEFLDKRNIAKPDIEDGLKFD